MPKYQVAELTFAVYVKGETNGVHIVIAVAPVPATGEDATVIGRVDPLRRVVMGLMPVTPESPHETPTRMYEPPATAPGIGRAVVVPPLDVSAYPAAARSAPNAVLLPAIAARATSLSKKDIFAVLDAAAVAMAEELAASAVIAVLDAATVVIAVLDAAKIGIALPEAAMAVIAVELPATAVIAVVLPTTTVIAVLLAAKTPIATPDETTADKAVGAAITAPSRELDAATSAMAPADAATSAMAGAEASTAARLEKLRQL